MKPLSHVTETPRLRPDMLKHPESPVWGRALVEDSHPGGEHGYAAGDHRSVRDWVSVNGAEADPHQARHCRVAEISSHGTRAAGSPWCAGARA